MNIIFIYLKLFPIRNIIFINFRGMKSMKSHQNGLGMLVILVNATILLSSSELQPFVKTKLRCYLLIGKSQYC